MAIEDKVALIISLEQFRREEELLKERGLCRRSWGTLSTNELPHNIIKAVNIICEGYESGDEGKVDNGISELREARDNVRRLLNARGIGDLGSVSGYVDFKGILYIAHMLPNSSILIAGYTDKEGIAGNFIKTPPLLINVGSEDHQNFINETQVMGGSPN